MNENTSKASSHLNGAAEPTPPSGSTEGLLTHISTEQATDFVAILPNENPEQIEMTIDALEEPMKLKPNSQFTNPIAKSHKSIDWFPTSRFRFWMTFRLTGHPME